MGGVVCINKILGRPISLITSMITDRIGRHKVLLLINHNHNKICDILSLLKIKTQNIRGFFASNEKQNHSSARAIERTVQLLRHDANWFFLNCPISADRYSWQPIRFESFIFCTCHL